jgi:hypothetical protein
MGNGPLGQLSFGRRAMNLEQHKRQLFPPKHTQPNCAPDQNHGVPTTSVAPNRSKQVNNVPLPAPSDLTDCRKP